MNRFQNQSSNGTYKAYFCSIHQDLFIPHFGLGTKDWWIPEYQLHRQRNQFILVGSAYLQCSGLQSRLVWPIRSTAEYLYMGYWGWIDAFAYNFYENLTFLELWISLNFLIVDIINVMFWLTELELQNKSHRLWNVENVSERLHMIRKSAEFLHSWMERPWFACVHASMLMKIYTIFSRKRTLYEQQIYNFKRLKNGLISQHICFIKTRKSHIHSKQLNIWLIVLWILEQKEVTRWTTMDGEITK